MASTVAEARAAVDKQVPLPIGYTTRWGGEFEEYTASRAQMNVVLPITILLIFTILFILYHNFKFPLITVIGVILSAPLGGLLAMLITNTPFSVSSMIGFLALFGVSVQTAVVYISYANELRLGGSGITSATREAALLRLRPIMMTALVAALGLLPAALSTGVGSDTQKPFALVIVGGLFSQIAHQRVLDARAVRDVRAGRRPPRGVGAGDAGRRSKLTAGLAAGDHCPDGGVRRARACTLRSRQRSRRLAGSTRRAPAGSTPRSGVWLPRRP